MFSLQNFHNSYCLTVWDTNNLFLPLSNLKSPACLAWDSNPHTVQDLPLETAVIPLHHRVSCIFLFNCRVIWNPLSYSFKSHLAKLSQLLLSHCLRYKTIIFSTLSTIKSPPSLAWEFILPFPNMKSFASLAWDSNPCTVQALALETAVIPLDRRASCIFFV